MMKNMTDVDNLWGKEDIYERTESNATVRTDCKYVPSLRACWYYTVCFANTRLWAPVWLCYTPCSNSEAYIKSKIGYISKNPVGDIMRNILFTMWMLEKKKIHYTQVNAISQHSHLPLKRDVWTDRQKDRQTRKFLKSPLGVTGWRDTNMKRKKLEKKVYSWESFSSISIWLDSCPWLM